MRDQKDLKKMIVAMAEIYGEILSDNRMMLYISLLQEFSREEIQEAMRKICMDPKITRFPLPAVIIAQIRPPVDIDAESRDGAARVIGAIAKFGYYGQEEAKKYLGEICWQAVDLMGGWVSLCENMRADEVTTYQAQFRELIKSTIQRKMSGIDHLTPGEAFFPKNPIVEQLTNKMALQEGEKSE